MTDNGYVPGDFFTVSLNSFIGKLIQIVTRSNQSHAGVIVDTEGKILEAEFGGASWNYIQRYENPTIHHVEMSDKQRKLFVTLATLQEGTPYGFLDILAVGLLQYGFKPRWLRERVRNQRNAICSQLVDRLEMQVGINLYCDGRIEQDVTPGDLDKLPMNITSCTK